MGYIGRPKYLPVSTLSCLLAVRMVNASKDHVKWLLFFISSYIKLSLNFYHTSICVFYLVNAWNTSDSSQVAGKCLIRNCKMTSYVSKWNKVCPFWTDVQTPIDYSYMSKLLYKCFFFWKGSDNFKLMTLHHVGASKSWKILVGSLAYEYYPQN